MLKGAGFTDADLARPLIGVATTWIETMPCNLNQRLLARHVKDGIRRAGGTPLEFNTIAVSDGVSMGTEGMRASLVSRDLIADSIELVVRGHLFDGLVCIVGCDKTIPAAVMALARLDLPGLVLLQRLDRAGPLPRARRDDPGRLRGDRRARRRDDERGRAARARERRMSGSRRVRRAVHREHDGDGARLPRRQRAGAERGAGDASGQAGRCRRGGQARGEARARGQAAVRGAHARGVRERDRVGRRDGRLDERRPAPARDRARGRHRAERSTTSTRSPAARRSSSTSSRPVASSRPTSTARAALRSSRASSSARERCTATRAASTAVRSARWRRARASVRARRSSFRWDEPLKPTGGLAILRGSLAPDGCVVKLAGHERLHHRGPGAGLRLGGGLLRRREGALDRRRATSSSSATKALQAGRACARCSTSPAPSSARGSATRSR